MSSAGDTSCPAADADWQGAVSLSVNPNGNGSGSKDFDKISATAYCYRVQACASGDCGAFSSGILIKVPALVGTPNLSLGNHDGHYDAVYDLSWSTIAGADSYEIKEWRDSNPEPLDTDSTAVSSYTGLTKNYTKTSYGGVYHYKVRACSVSGGDKSCTPWSSPAVNVDLTVPALGAGFGLANGAENPDGEGVYSLSWNALTAPNAAGLTLSYALDEIPMPTGETVCPAGDHAAAWASAAGVGINGAGSVELDKEPGDIFCYRLRACYGSDCGAWSALAVEVLSLSAPANLSCDFQAGDTECEVNGNTVYLTWEYVPDEDGNNIEIYEVESRLVPFSGTAGAWSQIELANPSCQDLGDGRCLQYFDSPTANGSHEYRVRACGDSSCAGVLGAWSDTVSVRVGIPPVSGLTSSEETSATDGDYTINWDTVTGATRYNVKETVRGEVAGAAVTNSHTYTNIQTNSYSALNKQGHAEYSYEVQACKSNVCSDWSDPQAVTVTLPSLGGLVSDETNNTSQDGEYIVSWDGPTPVASYAYVNHYELQEDEGSGWPSADMNVYEGLDRSADLSRGGDGSYTYQVRPCTLGVGCGYYSQSGDTLVVTVQAMEIPANLRVLQGSNAGSPVYVNTEPSNGDSYSLQWDSVTDAQAYWIEGVDGTSFDQKVSGSTSYQVTFAAPGSYSYTIRACEDAACNIYGPKSSDLEVSVYDLSPPLLSTNSTQVGLLESYILNWSMREGVLRYELRRGTTEVYSGTNTSHTETVREYGRKLQLQRAGLWE